MKDTRAKDVQEFFERAATDWDTMRLAYYDESVIERMAAGSGVAGGMKVADVGTGTGFSSPPGSPRGWGGCWPWTARRPCWRWRGRTSPSWVSRTSSCWRAT